MTEANAQEKLPDAESAPAEAAAATPTPEPWTGEKVSEWNAYYDLFVAAIVFLLAFFGSANKVTQPKVWNQLQSGRDIAETKSPVTTDRHSYTEDGHRWVHVSWLADLIHYEVYSLAVGFVQVDPSSQIDSNLPEVQQLKRQQMERNEQYGAAALIGLSAFLRALTVLVLLRIRHKGPGLWWAAVCAGVMLGVYYLPRLGFAFGGIAQPAVIDGSTWAQFLFAVELLWLFRIFSQGRTWPLFGLVPLFLIWANVDESFLFGLLIFAAAAIGHAFMRKPVAFKKPKEDEPETPWVCPKRALIFLGICAAICLVNPSIHLAYGAAVASLVPTLGWVSGPAIQEQLSYFGKTASSDPNSSFLETSGFFLITAGLGVISFIVNQKNFKLDRFLVFVVAAGLWAITIRQQPFFAIAMVAILTLNGQEWYHGLVGTEGRLGSGWAVFSTGGRAITLLAFAAAITLKLLNAGISDQAPQFGFGFDPDNFPFESAQAIADAPLEGNVFNTRLPHGDALIWRASPKRKTFIDSRRHLFTNDTIQKFETLQRALRDNDVPTTRQLLKEHNISAVMLSIENSPRTYTALLAGKQWIPFYDDGAVAMFGQPEAPANDLAYFQKNRLDADNLVYKNPRLAPSNETLPSFTSDLDKIYKDRTISHSQSHSSAAMRWTRPLDVSPETPYLSSPSQLIMAVRELREGLLIKPNDWRAYTLLAEVYGRLLTEESALIAGYPLTTNNIAAINSAQPQLALLGTRVRQVITTLNYAIMTTPPPSTADDFKALAALNMKLANYYYLMGCIDLFRDRIAAALENLSMVKDAPTETVQNLTKQLMETNNQLSELSARLMNLPVDASSGPLQKADIAQRNGAVGMAIQALDEAKEAGMNGVKPTLVDLLTMTGQPEKAMSVWTSGSTPDPYLSDGPGTAAMRQGRVFMLIGNYSSAIQLMARDAITELRYEDANKAPKATQSLIEGNPMLTVRSLLELPDDYAKLAQWEFEAGMACLEAGVSIDITAEHFTRALNFNPDLAVRPIIEYHLKKFDKPIPDNPRTKTAEATKPPANNLLPAPVIGAPK